MLRQFFESARRESAVRHGRIAAIFSLSNSASAVGTTIRPRIVNNVRCSNHDPTPIMMTLGLFSQAIRPVAELQQYTGRQQQVSYFVLRLL
jgi:hypothetical protein